MDVALIRRRAVLAGSLASLALTAVGKAAQSPDAKQKLISAYRAYLDRSEGNEIVWRDGTRSAWIDGAANKSFDDKLAHASLADQMSIPYARGPIDEPPPVDCDPGRFRNIAFFKKIYGADEASVRANLVEVPWRIGNYRGSLPFTRINGVDKVAAQIVGELAALPPRFARYLVSPAGSFDWRPIAGTSGLSAHAFGIAVDINAEHSDYWRWDHPPRWRSRIPIEIVDAFERHGFIWGGKWYHYDTMHFEYRPELIEPA